MAGVLLLAAADTATQNASIFSPASPPAHSIHSLAILIFAITGFIFLVVEGVLFYSVFRFRRRNSHGTSEPPQVYGSQPIEIAWTAAPPLIVVMIWCWLARARCGKLKSTPPPPKPGDNALFVTVIGPAMVVGIRLRPIQRPAPWLHHGQRAARPSQRKRHAAARLSDAEIGRRLPQLLGAAAGRQDRL